MNAKKLSLLVVINPNASRAEEALPKLTEWFAENTNAILMIAATARCRRRCLRCSS